MYSYVYSGWQICIAIVFCLFIVVLVKFKTVELSRGLTLGSEVGTWSQGLRDALGLL